ncbi:hypothetical protein CFOL_v3_02210, partial [Cephalotus follicularis]
FPTPTPHTKNVSATITLAGGSSRSRSRSNGASSFVITAFKNPVQSAPRTSSDGSTFGIVAKRIWSGFGSAPMKPSHSSVTTKVMSMLSVFEAKNLQRFIMGLMWPRPGKGMATTWQTLLGSKMTDAMPVILVVSFEQNDAKERVRF